VLLLRRGSGWGSLTIGRGKKNAFFLSLFILKNDHFAKTGSGQTPEKLKKKPFFAGPFQIAFHFPRQKSERTSEKCPQCLPRHAQARNRNRKTGWLGLTD
jgi:hypothetical protein